MNPHPMNSPQTQRKRLPFAIPLAFTTALGIGIVARFAPAAVTSGDNGRDPGFEPETPALVVAEQPAKVELSDVMLARTALTALDNDAEVRGANIVLSIVDRVAVLGGPVNGLRQSKRIEEIVRGIPGIADVRNNCFVSQGPDPLLSSVGERMASSLPPRPTLFELPGVLTGTMAPSFPKAGNDPGNNVASATPAGTVVVQRPPMETSVLGTPVSPATPAPITVKPSPQPVASPGTLTANRADVLAMAAVVRKTEARFANLTVEIRDGVLVISGSAPRPADAWDFAEKLRVLPGVARVAIGNVIGS
ncbi:MAG: BON domain-containing protein [Gemmataceae bacterium]